jgi:putative membrane-bound dehydrogenase-like protein
MKFLALIVALYVCVSGASAQSPVDATRTDGILPTAPSESAKTLRTKSGFHAELVASEPLIESPVAVAFGVDGKLWVAEMCDYPLGESPERGRIKCLYDDDGDGRYDRSEIFLKGLPSPTGVTVWRNGVLICAAPDILYAEDTNGDGTADKVEKLFTGFATHNFQARVNSLEYGLDGWVYGACGLFGGDITCLKTGEVVSIFQRDFRINPDLGVIEASTGATQQGRARNDWDDWFGCDNLTMLKHYPLADHYLRRNPYLTPAMTVLPIAAQPDPGRLFSISKQVLFMLSGPPDRPTAACGLGIYRDDLLGSEYYGNAFTCEPVNNLVHRQILSPDGVTFKSHRGDDEGDQEFLASTDPWFRPVQARTGPDGALWVVDMYRYVIEHPMWIPPDTLAKLDPRAGSTMGRIYRIVPDGTSLRKMPAVEKLKGEKLAAVMESPNGTVRDLIQQQIEWNKDKGAIPALKKIALENVRPEVRIQALSTWANLETPAADALQSLLGDVNPHVRRHAVRIAEPLLKTSTPLAAAVVKLAGDEDATVRMQVAYSSAFLTPADSAVSLSEIMAHDGGNAHLGSAEESALDANNIMQVLAAAKNTSAADGGWDRLLSHTATLAPADAMRRVLSELSAAVAQASKTPDTADLQRLAEFIGAWSRRTSPELIPACESVRAVWKPAVERALSILESEDAALERREAAVALLAQGAFLGEPHVESLVALLTPRTPPELQSAAIDGLKRDGSADVAKNLLSDWAAREPRLRKEVVAMLLTRETWTRELMAAITDRVVSMIELDLSQQQMLLDHPDQSIRAAATLSFRPRTSASRQQVIDTYTSAVNNNGDPGKGRLVFQKHCSVCHRIQDLGHAVGPDISAYSGKPVQSLLIAMLDPNQAVDPRYQAYVAVLNSGRSVTGLIAEETASGLTLLAPEGKRESALRSEVDEIRSTGKSLMPEGFEQNATTDDVNNLWAFFKTLLTPPKHIDGNVPAIVEIPAKGNVALLASQAEIYGSDITFERKYENIGNWGRRDDVVRWRINSPTIREVRVWTEWACDPGSAGSSFQIEGGQPLLKGVVESTGGWDHYQLGNIGVFTIQAGESEIVMRPSGDLSSALVDLRALHFVPPDGVPLAAGRGNRED